MVSVTTLAVVSIQSATFGLFVLAVRRRDVAAALNALGSFVLALLPVVSEAVLPAILARSVSVGSALPLWLAAAGLLHSIGMLGRYESVWWWDHLTHTVSAALVAALVYAGGIVALPDLVGVSPSWGVLAAVTLACTFAVGVFWELIELIARDVGERLDVEPVLVQYGWRDTAFDLVFDVVGALLVLVADLRIFVPVMEQAPEAAGAALTGAGWVVLVGSVLMALFVGLERSTAV